MQTDILLKRLQNFEFLRELGREILATLAKSAIWKVFAPDAVVFWEGDTETNLYYLQYGSLKVLKTSPEGREQVLRFWIRVKYSMRLACLQNEQTLQLRLPWKNLEFGCCRARR